MMRRKDMAFWLELLMWIAVTFGIIILSLISVSLPDVAGDNTDKVAHGFAYAVLGFLSLIAARRLGLPGAGTARGAFLWSAIYCALMGGGLEILQGFMDRTPDILDFAADMVGCVVGALLALATIGLFKRSRRGSAGRGATGKGSDSGKDSVGKS